MIRPALRSLLISRARRRISSKINAYTKSYYPRFDFSRPVDGEEEHRRKWSGFLNFPVDPLYFRLYSTLSGVRSPDYVPDDIYVIFLLKLLNDEIRDHVFRDKNIYDLYFGEGLFPKVYLRKIKGAYLDAEYRPVRDVKSLLAEVARQAEGVIVKPTVQTSSGKNVRYFLSDGFRFGAVDDTFLSLELLEQVYKDDFVLQERVSQHESLARFNRSSVNTVRIYTYRSFRDNEVHPLSFSLRVGSSGRVTDNLNSGGFGVGVSSDGALFKQGINKIAEKVSEINGIDLGKEQVIPGFQEFIAVSKFVGSRFLYDRFLGLDVFRDQTGRMRLMEVNLGHIGTGLPHLIGTPLFGMFTDEVIDYCMGRKHVLDEQYLLRL